MLVDTSGFFCLYDGADIDHSRALEFYANSRSRITTSYVLSEYVALAEIRGVPRSEIVRFSSRVLSEMDLEIVWVNEGLHIRAVELLARRLDKSYSLCDAVSFVLMRERGIADALTTDKHFEQEGFIRILR